jgi:hypothetical protein
LVAATTDAGSLHAATQDSPIMAHVFVRVNGRETRVYERYTLRAQIKKSWRPKQVLKTWVRVCYSWGMEPRYPPGKTQGQEYFRERLIPNIHNVYFPTEWIFVIFRIIIIIIAFFVKNIIHRYTIFVG